MAGKEDAMELKQINGHGQTHDCCGGGANAASGGEIDPVCGMTVNPATAAGQVTHAGQTYYFCSRHCVARFQAHPERYLGGAAQPPAAEVPAGAKYTCPMHPEIVQDSPGTCPKCGMALEAMQPTLEEGPDPELADMQRRFWIGAALALPVFLIAMAGLLPWPGLMHWLHANMSPLNWVQLALTTPVVLWCGWPFYQRAWMSLINKSPNMFTLIALGVGAAYLYSLAATIAPHLFPEGFRTAGGAVEPYFDSAAVIIVLVLLGQVMELKARSQTGAAIRALLGLAPKTARVILAGGREEDVPLAHVQVGDLIRIRPGEKVPVDGIVTEGAELARRGDGLRRADSRRKIAGQQIDRWNSQWHGRPGHAGRAGRRRYAARPDRTHGRRSPAQPSADRETGEQGRSGLCAGCAHRRCSRLCRLVAVGRRKPVSRTRS